MHAFESDSSENTSVIDPDGIDCVLAAGDSADLEEIRAWLRDLPETAYGQVFIEAADSSQIEALPLPANVAATWLCPRASGSGSCAALERTPGIALETAVDAWFDEWLWADSSTARNFHLWMGARESETMQSYWGGLDRKLNKRWPGFCDPNCARECLRAND